MIDLSEIVWKPGSAGKSRGGASGPKVSEKLETSDAFRRIPTEKVHIPSESRLVYHTDPRGPGADRFRLLRMRLREAREVVSLRSVIITSPLPEEGKSTVALNLATALGERGKKRVLLIEADLHRPTLAKRLGITAKPGLSECIEDESDPLEAIQKIDPLGFYLIQAGTPEGNATELLQSDRLGAIMDQLTPFFDWILVDTPPVLPLVDALAFSHHADTSLLVVRADQTPQGAIEDALSRLGPKHVLGIVLNGAEKLNKTYATYDGYYGKPKG